MLDFGAGLTLKGVDTFVIPKAGEQNDRRRPLNEDFALDVPAGTKWLEISIIEVDMGFGPLGNNHPKPVARMVFGVVPKLDQDGNLEVIGGQATVTAQGLLQDSNGAATTAGHFSIKITFQAKFFG